MDWWIGFTGFLVIVLIFVLAVVIRVRIQNANVFFVGNTVDVQPPAATAVVPVTVSGVILSDVLLPATTAAIFILNPFTGESTIVFDPTFPTSVLRCEETPFEVVFVPANINEGMFFTDPGIYPIEAVLFSNGLVFARAEAQFQLLVA